MKNFLLSLMVLFAFVTTFSKNVYANMLITPTLVVFEGRERFANVTLVNMGDKSYSYSMELIHMEMQEKTGAYAKIGEPPTGFDLSKHMIFSPRRVTLAPGAKQKIRLALRRPSEVPDGDYHVHLKFKSVKQGRDGASDENIEKARAVAATVSLNISYSIPVVFRVGEAVVDASIDGMELTRNKDTGLLDASVSISRDGGLYSVLGYLRIYHMDADSGREVLVGEISNANIFPEISQRIFSVPFTKNITSGSLRVVLTGSKKRSDVVYVERSFPVE